MISIATSDMYAKKAFRFENEAALCPFLSELDTEETVAQNREEQEIIKEMPHQHSMTEAAVGGSLAGILAGTLVGNIIAIFTGGALKALLSEIIAGIIAGVAAGIGLGKYLYENEGFARNGAVVTLEITRYRAIRLDDKVNRITTKLLGKDLPLTEKQQLWKARFFFQETLAKYQGIRISGEKDDRSHHEAQIARGNEGSPTLERNHNEARAPQQSDEGVQTEPENRGSAVIVPEQRESPRELQTERSTQESVDSAIQSETATEALNAAKEEIVPTFVECSEKSLMAAASPDQLAREVPIETRSTTVVNTLQAPTEAAKGEERLEGAPLDPQEEKDFSRVVDEGGSLLSDDEEYAIASPKDEERLGCKRAAVPPLRERAVVPIQIGIAQARDAEFQHVPVKLNDEQAVFRDDEARENQEEGPDSQQLPMTTAQIDELQKRSPLLGQRLKSLLGKEGVESELLHNILSLSSPSRMLEPYIQDSDIGFRDKNGKARLLVNRLAGIGGAGKLVSALKKKLEQGYDLFYDKNKRMYSDDEKTKMANFYSLLLMLSKQPVGIMHSDRNFGANFAQVMKGLTKEDQEMLQEYMSFRWPMGVVPGHIYCVKQALLE